jgi:hypothetical protein
MQPHTISHTGREPTAEKNLETRRDRSCHAVTARRRKKTNKDMGLVAQPAEDVASSYAHARTQRRWGKTQIYIVFLSWSSMQSAFVVGAGAIPCAPPSCGRNIRKN